MTVSMTQAIVATFQSLMSELHTCLPGRIEKYTQSTQKANVQPLLKKKYKDGTVESLPVLVNVPVVFPRTKSAGITFPISKGDGALLIFCERSTERWLSDGGEVEPGDPRKFDLSDAIAIPGLYSFSDSNIATSPSDLEIQNRDGAVAIGSNTTLVTQTLDGLVTGKSINPFTGTPYALLPGPNANGKNTSLKVRAEF